MVCVNIPLPATVQHSFRVFLYAIHSGNPNILGLATLVPGNFHCFQKYIDILLRSNYSTYPYRSSLSVSVISKPSSYKHLNVMKHSIKLAALTSGRKSFQLLFGFLLGFAVSSDICTVSILSHCKTKKPKFRIE